jgi:hypothetical protein
VVRQQLISLSCTLVASLVFVPALVAALAQVRVAGPARLPILSFLRHRQGSIH